MKFFLLVLVVAFVIGGFVGGELTDKSFSPTGALVGGGGLAIVLLSLGAFFEAQDQKRRRKNPLPPEIRGVFDRLVGRKLTVSNSKPEPAAQQPNQDTSTPEAAERKAIAAARMADRTEKFMYAALKMGLQKDSETLRKMARPLMRGHPDPYVAAMEAHKLLLNSLLDSSADRLDIIGYALGNTVAGLSDLVAEGRMDEEVGRDYFQQFMKVPLRVHGYKIPFEGGLLEFESNLELARARMKLEDR